VCGPFRPHGSPPSAARFRNFHDTRTGPRRASALDSAIRLSPGPKVFESHFGRSVDRHRTGQYNFGQGPSECPSERDLSTGPLPSHQIVSIFRRLVSIRPRFEHECSFVSVGRVERQAILRYSEGVFGYGQMFTPADMAKFGKAPQSSCRRKIVPEHFGNEIDLLKKSRSKMRNTVVGHGVRAPGWEGGKQKQKRTWEAGKPGGSRGRRLLKGAGNGSGRHFCVATEGTAARSRGCRL